MESPLRAEARCTQLTVFLMIFAAALVTALALFVRSLYLDASQYTTGPPPGDHTRAALVAYINGTALLTYVLLDRDYTPVLVDHFGRPHYPARFLQWMLTTPIMIYLTASISGQSHRQIILNTFCDLFILMVGLNGLLSSSNLMSGVCLTAAGFAFVTLLRNVHRMTNDAVLETRDSGCHWSFHLLQIYILTTWTAFPCVAFLSETNLVSPIMEAHMFLALELACKFVFSALLLEGKFLSLEENRRVAEVARDESNKSALIEQLQQAITEKNRFLASVSHELRTPLNGIIGLSDAMLLNLDGRLQGSLGEVNEDMKKTLETIKQSGGRLKNLVNDILDVESLRQRKLTLHYEVVYLRHLVDHVMDLTSPMVKWNVKLYNDVSKDIPEIDCNQARLIQILHNLVGNAAKFTDGGEIRVCARVRETDDGHEFMIVDVRDTGIGIPSHKLQTIFLAFEQVNETSMDQRGGTGLGLFLVDSLVRAHGGTISVTSEIGHGSCFTLKLPLKHVDVNKSKPGPAPRSRLVSLAVKTPDDGLNSTPKTASSKATSPKATSPKGTSPKAVTPPGARSPKNTSPKAASPAAASPMAASLKQKLTGSPGRMFVCSDGKGHVTLTPKTALAAIPDSDVTQDEKRAVTFEAGGAGIPKGDGGSTPESGKKGSLSRCASTRLVGNLYVGEFELPKRAVSAPATAGQESSKIARKAGSLWPDLRSLKPVEVELSFKDQTEDHSSTAVHYPTKLRSHYEVHGQYEILSVDDDRVNQMVVDGLLRPAGYKITKKMDGMEALAYLEGSEVIPDLIMLDVMMPGLDGYEVCKKVREMFPSSALPVIMVSAKSQEGDIVKGLRAGSNDYLTKPFKRLEILARIEVQLKIKRLWRVEIEAKKSYQLLKKMLPDSIIERLSAGQSLIADSHKEVTILFSDIVGFTEISGSSATEDLILMLNEMFTAFDALVDKHGVYKVETIGDAYMVVAGHDGSPDHALRIVRMAMDMLAKVRDVKQPNHVDPVRIRVGIHTGPAYAGVIGTKCPRYCFFGDTVNTASRMESNGFQMSIHTSMTTYERCQDSFEFAPVGRRIIKGKGPMETFLLKYGEYEAGLQALRAENRPTLARSDSSPDLLKRHAKIDPASLPPSVSPLLKQSLEGPSRKTSRFKSEGPRREQDVEFAQDLPSGYVSDDVSCGGGPAPGRERKLDRTRTGPRKEQDLEYARDLPSGYVSDDVSCGGGPAPGREKKLERTRTPPRRSLGSALLGITPLRRSGSFSGMTAQKEESAPAVNPDPVRTLRVDESSVNNIPVVAAQALNRSGDRPLPEHVTSHVAVPRPSTDLGRVAAQQMPSGRETPAQEDGIKWRTGLGVQDGLSDPTGLFEILDGMGLGRYASVLEEAEVTVDILATMTPEQLKEAGVQAIGARLRILEAFRAPKATGST
ncbi:hypothetical protein KFL_004210020 [Klebsormidium nitens]|uniref:histidine kinase n=1 Tax=Klebsormidium nitens TaxID=105231 RepID=A0A1Y1IBK3_KLENI|nr:hypothetical protein KFL_004210020 [Klebsormidium nitens]|eukprot:GAQ88354.1 hypothetical protein KFL_004210020 [Klebsormidium nitens]